MTRVCIPTEGTGGLDAPVGEHFGRVPTYTIFETETEQVEVVDNTSEHMGGAGYPAEIIAGLNIEVLLCSGLGRRAIQMLGEQGIEVFSGFAGTAQQALDAWKAGGSRAAGQDDACTRHMFHDHG